MLVNLLQSTASADPMEAWHEPVRKSVVQYILPGLLIVMVAIGGFGYWAVTAPLSSAAVARGVFVATGQNKLVQHLEGGIIRKILVSEGQRVEPDQILIELAGTKAQADVNRLQLRSFTLRALTERLTAARLGKRKLTFSSSLTSAAEDPQYLQVLETQRNEFDVRQKTIDEERSVIEKRISAIQEEISGLAALKESNAQQSVLLVEELRDAEELFEKGLMQKTRYLQIKRSVVSLKGENANYAARIAQAKQRISEAQTQIAQMESKYREQAVSRFADVQTELDDISERLVSARDVLRRQSVVAPTRGVVVKMNFHTAGAVIGPGQAILELLPTDEKLVIEAFVRPEDIDSVYKGLEAHVRLIALNQRKTPMVTGQVVYVSADAIQRNDSNDVHYVARVLLNPEEISSNKHIKLAPGMPAEVYIQTGERTFLDYIVNPISGSFQRAFREE